MSKELRILATKSRESWVNGKWHTRPTLDIGVDEVDSDYIAAASPDVVLGLLDRIEQAAQPEPIKDHEIAKLVGDIAAVAREFHDQQSLRERISQLVRPWAKPDPAEPHVLDTPLTEEAEQAFTAFGDAYVRMETAMKDGINVHGALSNLIGCQDNLRCILAAAKGGV